MKHDPRAFAPPAFGLQGDRARDVTERVRRFMPMVRRLARQHHRRAPGGAAARMELDDLMQAGLVALTECAQRHEQGRLRAEERGQAQEQGHDDGFAAYAKLRVRGAMVDLVRRAAPLSRGGADRRRLLRAMHESLRRELGRDPTPGEVAAVLGLAPGELAVLRVDSQPLRFEPMDEVYSDHNPAFADDRRDSHTLLADEQSHATVRAATAALAERLHLVVRLYFIEERNLAEIAQVLQVSIPRVHQLKAQVLEQLRAELAWVL